LLQEGIFLSGGVLRAAETENPRAYSREMIGLFLAADRGFPGGFWHPEDEEGLVGVMGSWLERNALPNLLSDPKLTAELQRIAEAHPGGDEEEDEARRMQVTCVAARVNETSGAKGTRRLYEFAEDIQGWEADEPVWLFLTTDERTRLLALGIVHPLAAAAGD
jgi:hypothetical protein